MINFEYTRVSTVKAAIDTMVKHPGAKLIAGGTNLVDLMKKGVTTPHRLIDINGLPLKEIKENVSEISIGALVINSDLAAHAVITICHAFYGSDFFPLLHYG